MGCDGRQGPALVVLAVGSSAVVSEVALGERERVLISLVAACGRGPGRGGEEQEQEGQSERHTEDSTAGLRPGENPGPGRDLLLSLLSVGLHGFKTATLPPCCRRLAPGSA